MLPTRWLNETIKLVHRDDRENGRKFGSFMQFTKPMTCKMCSLLCLKLFATVAEGRRLQERDGLAGGDIDERENQQDAGQGLQAHGADVAAGPQQDGVHPHRLRRPPGHPVQRPPAGGVHQVQPRPGEHAPGRRLPAVRAGRGLILILILAVRIPDPRFALAAAGNDVSVLGVGVGFLGCVGVASGQLLSVESREVRKAGILSLTCFFPHKIKAGPHCKFSV